MLPVHKLLSYFPTFRLNLKFDDFHKLVNSIVLDKYVDIKDIKSNYRHAPKSRQFLANRLITGKAAEEYFVMNYPRK